MAATQTKKPKGKKAEEQPEEEKPAKAPKKVLITTKNLVEETGVPGTEIRKILRAQFYSDGVFTRYGWDPESKEDKELLTRIRKAIQDHVNGKAEKKETSKTVRNERAQTRRKKTTAAVAEEPDSDELEEDEEFEEFDEEEELDSIS